MYRRFDPEDTRPPRTQSPGTDITKAKLKAVQALAIAAGLRALPLVHDSLWDVLYPEDEPRGP